MGNNMTPELLAPAGSPACLMAALNQGADAVYLGLDKFNARMNAENFTLGNLKHYVRLCRIGGAKIYVALNTLVKDSEFNEAFKTAVAVFGEGADAVIVQDLGLAYRLKAVYPSAALHISTQAGIHNVYGAAFAKALGASRVILARETALADIQAVAASGIETEVFIHGALCSSVSGVCYYSSLASGLSGNRGRCLQLCRKKYDKDGTGGYFLSVKDLCLIGRVRELLDAGVACFKIEGRMRRPEYTAQAVKSYRAALDAVRDG
ncbi:MAG: U32 family peptidase, partial [Firmicutes bacterium]|nr:U32 family peptidase [Bacillota bacterium]